MYANDVIGLQVRIAAEAATIAFALGDLDIGAEMMNAAVGMQHGQGDPAALRRLAGVVRAAAVTRARLSPRLAGQVHEALHRLASAVANANVGRRCEALEDIDRASSLLVAARRIRDAVDVDNATDSASSPDERDHAGVAHR